MPFFSAEVKALRACVKTGGVHRCGIGKAHGLKMQIDFVDFS